MGLFDLTGRVAVVTGSSRGIGRAIVERMAEAGAHVVVSSRKREACEAVVAGIADRHGADRAIAIAAGLSDKAALLALIDRTAAWAGGIDILVCNAASNPHYGPLATISDEAFRKILDNNLLANHWLAQAAAPHMIARGGGAIILVSSIGGLIGSDVIGAYNVSKAADMQFVRNLAVELGPKGVRANAIAPGVIRTDFARALWEDPEAEARLNRMTPLGRIGEPDDVAGAALFLASDAGRHVTGQTIVVDGGAMVRGTI